MYCRNCGNKLNEGNKFCANCGTPVLKKEINNFNQNLNSNPKMVINSNEMPIQNDDQIEPVEENVLQNNQENQTLNENDYQNEFPYQNIQMNNIPFDRTKSETEKENSQNSNDNVFDSGSNLNSSFNSQNEFPNNSLNQNIINDNNSQNNQNVLQPDATNNDNSYKEQATQVKPTKGNNTLVIVIALLALAIIGVILYLIFRNPTTNLTDKLEIEEKEETNNILTIGDYKISAPKNYEVSEQAGTKVFINQTDKTMIMVLSQKSVTFEYLKKYQIEVKAELEKKGFKINDYSLKTVNGEELLIYDGVLAEIPVIDIYAAGKASDFIEIGIYNYGSKKSSDLLNVAAEILKNMTYIGTKNFTKVEDDSLEEQNLAFETISQAISEEMLLIW